MPSVSLTLSTRDNFSTSCGTRAFIPDCTKSITLGPILSPMDLGDILQVFSFTPHFNIAVACFPSLPFTPPARRLHRTQSNTAARTAQTVCVILKATHCTAQNVLCVRAVQLERFYLIFIHTHTYSGCWRLTIWYKPNRTESYGHTKNTPFIFFFTFWSDILMVFAFSFASFCDIWTI